jgi:glycosyltransferase involved in cell wall biosynthesis
LERDLPTLLISHGVPTAALHTGIYPPDATQALVAHLAGVDRIVTVASHLEAILSDFGVTRVETISTGVDVERLRPRAKDPQLLRSLGIEEGQFVVGSFSHHRSEKRLTDVVASAELVLRSAPHVVYLVAGDGPCRHEIAELIEAKGLSASFRVTGELDHADVPAYLALAHAVVLASEREGCPLICLEAHAAGRALIVSDIPAGREAARGGETGLLFRLGDVADLAARTLELVNDDTLRAKQAANGLAAVGDHSTERWIQSCSDALVRTARRRR